MNDHLATHSWLEQRLEAFHEKLIRGEIDEEAYQAARERLWRTYDNLVECSLGVSDTDAEESAARGPETKAA
jgi:hypothetical protein